MLKRLGSDPWWRLGFSLLCLLGGLASSYAAQMVIHLKNGDRITGSLVSETTNSLTLATPFLGKVPVPLSEIEKRELIPEIRAMSPPASPNAATTVTNRSDLGPTPELKVIPPKKPPLAPANPEAGPIASAPHFWKHDIRFGLNTRYAAQDSHEILLITKSTYGHPPFRHILESNLKYGTIEGVVSANSLNGSEKTEYQLTPKTYLFSLVGGGFDEIRHIRGQFDAGPGVGFELLKLTNFVWKTESGFNFEKQYLSSDNEQTSYSIRIAEIFAWRVWEKLTADAKVEFFADVAKPGEYRLRLESTLRYPVSTHLSLNLDLIDAYDTRSAPSVTPNDLQIRSTIGVAF